MHPTDTATRTLGRLLTGRRVAVLSSLAIAVFASGCVASHGYRDPYAHRGYAYGGGYQTHPRTVIVRPAPVVVHRPVYRAPRVVRPPSRIVRQAPPRVIEVRRPPVVRKPAVRPAPKPAIVRRPVPDRIDRTRPERPQQGRDRDRVRDRDRDRESASWSGGRGDRGDRGGRDGRGRR